MLNSRSTSLSSKALALAVIFVLLVPLVLANPPAVPSDSSPNPPPDVISLKDNIGIEVASPSDVDVSTDPPTIKGTAKLLSNAKTDFQLAGGDVDVSGYSGTITIKDGGTISGLNGVFTLGPGGSVTVTDGMVEMNDVEVVGGALTINDEMSTFSGTHLTITGGDVPTLDGQLTSLKVGPIEMSGTGFTARFEVNSVTITAPDGVSLTDDIENVGVAIGTINLLRNLEGGAIGALTLQPGGTYVTPHQAVAESDKELCIGGTCDKMSSVWERGNDLYIAAEGDSEVRVSAKDGAFAGVIAVPYDHSSVRLSVEKQDPVVFSITDADVDVDGSLEGLQSSIATSYHFDGKAVPFLVSSGDHIESDVMDVGTWNFNEMNQESIPAIKLITQLYSDDDLTSLFSERTAAEQKIMIDAWSDLRNLDPILSKALAGAKDAEVQKLLVAQMQEVSWSDAAKALDVDVQNAMLQKITKEPDAGEFYGAYAASKTEDMKQTLLQREYSDGVVTAMADMLKPEHSNYIDRVLIINSNLDQLTPQDTQTMMRMLDESSKNWLERDLNALQVQVYNKMVLPGEMTKADEQSLIFMLPYVQPGLASMVLDHVTTMSEDDLSTIANSATLREPDVAQKVMARFEKGVLTLQNDLPPAEQDGAVGVGARTLINAMNDPSATLRIIGALSKGFGWEQEALEEVYKDPLFLERTAGMPEYERFGIAVDASRGRAAGASVDAAVQDVMVARDAIKDDVVIGPGVQVLPIAHTQFGNGPIIKLVEDAGGEVVGAAQPGVTDAFYMGGPGGVQGSDSKSVTLAVASTPSDKPLVLWFNTHGNWDEQQFASSAGQGDMNDANTLSYVELGDALYKRGNLQNVKVVLDSCFGYDYGDNLITYLKDKAKYDGVPFTPPVIITATNRGMYSYGGDQTTPTVFTAAVEQAMNDAADGGTNQPITYGTLYDSKKYSFVREDMTIRTPKTIIGDTNDAPAGLVAPAVPTTKNFVEAGKIEAGAQQALASP